MTDFRLPRFLDMASAMAEDIARDTGIHAAAATMAAIADHLGESPPDDLDPEAVDCLRVPWWDADLVEDCAGVDPDQQGRTPLMSDELWA